MHLKPRTSPILSDDNIKGTLCSVTLAINEDLCDGSRSNDKQLSWCTSSWLERDDARVVGGSCFSKLDNGSANVKAYSGTTVITNRDD